MNQIPEAKHFYEGMTDAQKAYTHFAFIGGMAAHSKAVMGEAFQEFMAALSEETEKGK